MQTLQIFRLEPSTELDSALDTMGCSQSKIAPTSQDPPTAKSLDTRRTAASATSVIVAAAETGSAPELVTATKRLAVVIDKASKGSELAQTAVSAVQDVLGDDLPEVLACVQRVAQDYAPALCSVMTTISDGASNVLGALAPAASFAGPVLVVAKLVLDQFGKYAEVQEQAAELRATILQLSPLIEDFARTPVLAKPYAKLLGVACLRLVTAMDAIEQVSKKAGVGARFTRFVLAGNDLQCLTDAAGALQGCIGFLGAASSIAGARIISDVQATTVAMDRTLEAVRADGAEVLALLKTDPQRREKLVAALTEHVLVENARAGRRLPPMFGLNLEDLEDVPPAEVALWLVEEGEAGAGAGPPVMQASGRTAMRELLAPRKAPGVRVVIGGALEGS